MLAKVNGLFRLTRDAELIYTQSGTAMAKLGLACSEKYKDKETQLFIDGIVFGKPAEIISQYAGSKGSQLFLSGKLQTESWEDKQTGKMRSKISMSVEGFEFVGKGKETQLNKPVQNNTQTPQVQVETIPQDNESGYHPNQGSFQMDNNELPF